MAVIGYCNQLSVDKDASNHDPGYYRKQIRGYAMLRSLELEKCFFEFPAHSLRPFLKRRRAKKMLADLKEGDVLIAPDIERIFCSATDAVTSIEHLRDAGVALHIAAWGDDILNAHCREGVWPLLQFLARAERRVIRQRTSTSNAMSLESQRRGRIPFGYTIKDGKRQKNRKEQEAIRYMQKLKANGLSYAAVASEVESRLGYSFSHMGVKKILERQRNIDDPMSESDAKSGE